jgi:hypothetical protein
MRKKKLTEDDVSYLDKYFNIVDNQIFMCDNTEEIGMLASVMLARSRDMMLAAAGVEKTRYVLELSLKLFNDEYPPGGQYDTRTKTKPPKNGPF